MSGRGRLRSLLPWLVGAAILLALLHRVPVAALKGGLAGGPWGVLVVYTLPFIVVTLSFSLAFSLLGLASQALVGAACLAALRRRGGDLA